MKKILAPTLIVLLLILLPTVVLGAESSSQFLSTGLADNACRDPFLVFRKIATGDPITSATDALGYTQCLAFSAIRLLMSVAVVAAGVLVAINGVRYQFARGNPKLVEAAVKNIQTALIGLALLFLLGTAINAVLTFIEYDYLANPGTQVEIRDPARPAPSPAAEPNQEDSTEDTGGGSGGTPSNTPSNNPVNLPVPL